jgi:hypothetical protein
MDLQKLEREAITIVNEHVAKYKDPHVFITENVSFSIRPLIRLLRKNYYGVFETPTDKNTGRKKIWVPLTQTMCDGVTKNSDIDTKDATFTSRTRGGIASTELVRATVRRELEDTYFGQDLDMAIRTLSIDPTIVWKLTEYKKNGKTHVNRQQIDVLNVYIDPSAKTLHDVDFAERALMTKAEMRDMTGWKDVEKAVEQENLSRYDDIMKGARTTGKMVEVYEFHGMVPEYLITGKESDKKKVPARIVTSGSGEASVLHFIEKNTKKDKHGNSIKQYEEGWYTKLPWSWYGISPAWKVLDLQEYINATVNIRINRNTVAQYGIFKMRDGSGIRQKDFARLGSNGVIKVKQMDDLEQFQVQEAGPGSYRDEEMAKQWASEVTSAFDIVRGAQSPSSATATAQAIEDRNSKSAFLLIKDSIGYFLERVIDHHYLPLVPKMIKENGIVRISGEVDNIEDLRERIVAYLAMEELDKLNHVPTREELDMAMESADRKLRSDKDLFVDSLEEIIVSTLDTRVTFTNEEMDNAIIARNIIDMMRVVPPEMHKDLIGQLFDLFGLERPRIPVAPQVPGVVSVATQGATPSSIGAPTLQSLTTGANTMQGQ